MSNMLLLLEEAERELPTLLAEGQGWHSLNVDYHPPFVERLWRPYGEGRLYLHRIHPCLPSAALFHPHPWPSAMRVVEGRYEMAVGYGPGMNHPPVAATMILTRGSAYEMDKPDSWHYVRPLDKPTLSVMVTGKLWDREAPKSDKPLSPLHPVVIGELFSLFQKYYPQELPS